MSLLDNQDEDPPIVNILDFLREHGLEERESMNLILHLLLTRSYAIEADVREAAQELNIRIPFINWNTSGNMH